jgi:hypothetical protein
MPPRSRHSATDRPADPALNTSIVTALTLAQEDVSWGHKLNLNRTMFTLLAVVFMTAGFIGCGVKGPLLAETTVV